MATRNIVPRAAGEGKVGTAGKPWNEVNAEALPLTIQLLQTTQDENTSSQSLANVPGLASIALKAGGTYRFRVRAQVQTNATSVGILLSINADAAVTSINYIHRYPTSATAWTEERVTALQGGTLPATGPGTTNTPYWLEGTVVAAQDCTLAVQFRSETATQTTVKAGSYIEVIRIA